MKRAILNMLAVLLLMCASAAADDVTVDSSGNISTGVSNSAGNFVVTAASGEDAIAGETSGTGVAGVYGINTTYGYYGVLGEYSYGVYGWAPGGNYGYLGGANYGAYGYGSGGGVGGYSFSGNGIYGASSSGTGVMGQSSTGMAGYFIGNVMVTGNLTVDGIFTGPNIGDITGVTAGTGLGGGGSSGAVTLNADTTYLQRRVSSSCTVGSSIRAINADGTVMCEATSSGGGVGGSGSLNYVPKWTGATALGDSSIYQAGTDYIGIGTTSPESLLHVTDTAAGSLTYPLKLSNRGGTADTAAGLLFQVDGGGEPRGKGAIVYERTGTWNRGDIHFLQNASGNYDIAGLGDTVMTIKNDGNVGVGSTDPADKLTVAGTISSTSGGVKFPDGSVQTAACNNLAPCILFRTMGLHPPAECFSQISDTGQTTCYASHAGEDCLHSIRPQSYASNGTTVIDVVTGLTWQAEDDNTTRTWTSAMTYCNDLVLGDFIDWRLPDEFELMGIVHYDLYSPAINYSAFPNTNASYYWSSTTDAAYSSMAWVVNFDHGAVGQKIKSENNYVRCVRGGQ